MIGKLKNQRKKKSKFQSLSFKISFLLSACFFLIMLIFGSVSYYQDNRQITQEIKNAAELMGERLGNSLRVYLWNFDRENASVLIDNEMKYRHVQAIVVNTYYKDFFIGKFKDSDKIYDIGTDKKTFQKNIADNFFHIKKNILHKNPVNTTIELGTIDIYFTDIYLIQRRNQIIFKILWQTILVTIVIISVSFISLKILILNRLRKLNAVVDNFDSMKMQSKIIVKSNDEIGQLNRSFNTMLTAILTFRNHMQELIEERTLELKEKNEQLEKTYKHLKQELIMAQYVQNSIIPKELPNNEYMSLNGLYLPMEELGGDYYDVFKFSETRFGLVIADVSGHGLSAAMIASMVKVVFDNFANDQSSTNHVINLVNNELCHSIGSLGKYITLFYGIIDLDKGELQYTNAGHYPIFLVKNNKTVKALKSKSLIVASFSKAKYKSDIVSVNRGDRLVLYTDGIPETRNKKNEIFGIEKLKNLILNNEKNQAQELINNILIEITNYRESEILEDDLTILIADIKK